MSDWDRMLDPPDEPELTDECGHCGAMIAADAGFCSRACARASECDRHEPEEEDF